MESNRTQVLWWKLNLQRAMPLDFLYGIFELPQPENWCANIRAPQKTNGKNKNSHSMIWAEPKNGIISEKEKYCW